MKTRASLDVKLRRLLEIRKPDASENNWRIPLVFEARHSVDDVAFRQHLSTWKDIRFSRSSPPKGNLEHPRRLQTRAATHSARPVFAPAESSADNTVEFPSPIDEYAELATPETVSRATARSDWSAKCQQTWNIAIPDSAPGIIFTSRMLVI